VMLTLYFIIKNSTKAYLILHEDSSDD